MAWIEPIRTSPATVAPSAIRNETDLRTMMAGPRVGLKEVEDAIWLVSFMHYDLGYIG